LTRLCQGFFHLQNISGALLALFVRLIGKQWSGDGFSQISRRGRFAWLDQNLGYFYNYMFYIYFLSYNNLASSMHPMEAIAVSEIITPRSEETMKKIITTIAALAFALGLTASGFAQTTTVKEGEKPAVKTQIPASGPQVTPLEKDQGKEAVHPVTKEAEPAKGKKPVTMASKKEGCKKPGSTAPDTKKEGDKDVTK
jgi:hypothetical protein